MGTHKIAEFRERGETSDFFGQSDAVQAGLCGGWFSGVRMECAWTEDQKYTENNLVSDFFLVRRPILVKMKKRFRKASNKKEEASFQLPALLNLFGWKLLTKSELLDQGAVLVNVFSHVVRKKTLTLTYHVQQCTTSRMVFFVSLKVLTQALNPVRLQGNLSLYVPGVFCVAAVLLYDLGHFFRWIINCHFLKNRTWKTSTTAEFWARSAKNGKPSKRSRRKGREKVSFEGNKIQSYWFISVKLYLPIHNFPGMIT